MKLIIGLGNPGKEYANTRHNAGFVVVEEFAAQLEAAWSHDKERKSMIAKANFQGQNFLLAKPQTFMNLSGESVQSLLAYYKIPSNDVLIVQDELDLAPGIFAFTPQAGTAGHHGIASIFEHLGRTDLQRLRIGIGRPIDQTPIEDWVLQKMDDATRNIIPNATDALRTWITNGLSVAMNTWNRKT